MVHSEDSRTGFAGRLKDSLRHANKGGRGEGARLARVAGVSPKAASKWLNGEARPSHDKLCVIAAWLGVREEWLAYGQGEMLRPQIGDAVALAPRIGAYAPQKGDGFTWASTEVVEEPGPPGPDEVDLPCFREVEFAAGDGRTQVIENHGHTMRFSLAKLARAGVRPEMAACATASGTSMEPTIMDGSPIGIDKGSRHIIDGKIYALDHGGMLRIKRLYKLPLGRVRLVSDNAAEYPEEVCGLLGPDAPRVIGRVFWWEVFD